MKRLIAILISMTSLTALTGCGSQDVSFSQLPLQSVTTQNSVQTYEEEEHTVTSTTYQNPINHYNSMKMEIDFSCPEGGHDSLTASSFLPTKPYQLTITHHTGKIDNVDLTDKKKVAAVIEFVSAFKVPNQNDAKVVSILLTDLKGMLNSKKIKTSSK